MLHREDYFLKNGHLNDYSISLIIDDIRKTAKVELTPEVDDHLDKCPVCKDKIMDILSSTIITSSSTKRSSIEKKNIIKSYTDNLIKKRYIGQIAATFILILFLSVFYTTKISKKRTLTETNNKKSKISFILNKSKTEKKNPEINSKVKSSLRFDPNPNLEAMTNGIERSSLSSQKSFHSLVRGNDNVKFTWGKIDSKELTLSIVDNKNFIVFTFSVSANNFILNKKLLPGLYYWKLTDKNNLYYIGKFKIAPYPIPPIK